MFPGITPHLLVLEQMFWIPFFRDLWSTTGSVAATKVRHISFSTCVLLPTLKSFQFRKGWRVCYQAKREVKPPSLFLVEHLRLSTVIRER